MYKFVYLLLFVCVSLANCQYARNLTMDIKLDDNGRKVACNPSSSGERLIDGELIRLIANVPYEVHYNWCEVGEKIRTVDRCEGTDLQCWTTTRFASSQRGTWNCRYLMIPNKSFEITPTIDHEGKNYTVGVCTLNFEAEETLWFTGLDPNRRTINRLGPGLGPNYAYKFDNKENLNITCQSDEKVNVTKFEFYDAAKKKYKTLNGKTFQMSADFNLHGSLLSCNSEGKHNLNYTIHLNLDLNQKVWLTGLDAARTTIKPISGDTEFKYTYTFENNEELDISCASDELEFYELKFWDAETKSSHSSREKRFVKCVHNELHGSNLYCYFKDKKDNQTVILRLDLESKTPVVDSRNITSIELVGMMPIDRITNLNKTYEYKFSKPEYKFVECRINQGHYGLILKDGTADVAKTKKNHNAASQTSVSYNFTLDAQDKTISCLSDEENNSASKRVFSATLYVKYNPTNDGTTTTMPATTENEVTAQPDKVTGDGTTTQAFLETNWLFILLGCAIIITICIVAFCLKHMCSKKSLQPPESYTNLTNDRRSEYPTMPASTGTVRTMPKMESNYCDPKDIQKRKNNVEPNYSEAKEPGGQCIGEGLYAELNRPEDTYAEPYINKTELYARPIPKAERVKKDDPNYSNVFGQEYVNSRK